MRPVPRSDSAAATGIPILRPFRPSRARRMGIQGPTLAPTDRPIEPPPYGPSGHPCKAWVTHRPPAAWSLLGVDSGRIVRLGPRLVLGLFSLAAPRLRLAALEVVAQRSGETLLRRRFFPLLGGLAHADKVAPAAALWQGSRQFRRSHATRVCAPQ